MAVSKGYAPPAKKIHDLVKKGYTAAHHANERKKKFKKMKLESGIKIHNGIQPGLEMGNNNLEENQS